MLKIIGMYRCHSESGFIWASQWFVFNCHWKFKNVSVSLTSFLCLPSLASCIQSCFLPNHWSTPPMFASQPLILSESSNLDLASIGCLTHSEGFQWSPHESSGIFLILILSWPHPRTHTLSFWLPYLPDEGHYLAVLSSCFVGSCPKSLIVRNPQDNVLSTLPDCLSLGWPEEFLFS